MSYIQSAIDAAAGINFALGFISPARALSQKEVQTLIDHLVDARARSNHEFINATPSEYPTTVIPHKGTIE
jgi:hypothetical protein